MTETGSRQRAVFVLGRDASLDVGSVVSSLEPVQGELVLVCVGHRVSPAQDAIVGQALRLVEERRFWLDVQMVGGAAEVAALLEPGEPATVLATGSESRAIRRALGGHVRRPVLPGTNAVVSLRRAISKAADPSVVRPEVGSFAGTPGPAGPKATVPAVSGAGAGSEPGNEPGTDGGREPRAGPGTEPETGGSREGSPGSESVEALTGRTVPPSERDTVWTRDEASAKKAAPLRVYLGAAPGVGKTFAMLGEGRRRRERGTDVVVGIVQTYGRPKTIEMLEGLEVLPPRPVIYRGAQFGEMDTEALIARRPEVALVDELAHTNVPGTRRAKRWEDVIDLLAEGVEVITTVNVQHLTSLNDVVAQLTGVRQQETIPDWVLDLADQVELVDMSPYALQRRMMHGNVYPDPHKAELALRRYFTLDNLTALRELALMRVANQVDETLLAGWSRPAAPETRERVLVCVSRPELSEQLIRRAARIARRAQGDLLVAHVSTGHRLQDPDWVERSRRLAEELGGSFDILEADDPVDAVLAFAYRQRVTQIVVGESLRSKWQERIRGSFVDRLIQKASNVDVHVIARRER
jgi:hypothetical protein